MQDNGTAKVNMTIEQLYERKRIAAYALCLHYAAKALQYFRSEQESNRFWINRTGLAKDTVFSGAFKEGQDIIGWFMAHALQYGAALELKNNRKHEALRPVIEYFHPEFMYHLRGLYAD